ncbi:MAG: LysR family transcriptional regulator [Pseudomonadota bacterium]
MILDGIDIFTEVVDAQSFSRAARRLGMPTSTVSAKIARLEARLETTLLRRTTRQIDVTPAGKAYYDRCVAALAELSAAEQELSVQSTVPTGSLRITAPADLAQFKLVPVIEAFLDRFAGTRVDLRVSNAQTDLLTDGIDLAVRAARFADSSLIATKYIHSRVGLWASSGYLETHGKPETVEDVLNHQTVVVPRVTPLLHEIDPTGTLAQINSKGRIKCDDMLACRAFLLADAGIGLLPDFLARAAGAPLIRVLGTLESKSTPIHFVYPAQRFVAPNVRAFIDLAKAMEARHVAG